MEPQQFTEKDFKNDQYWGKELAECKPAEKLSKIIIDEINLCIEVSDNGKQTIDCIIAVQPASILDDSILDLNGQTIVFNELITEKAIKDAIRKSSYLETHKDMYVENPDIVIKKYRIERVYTYKKFKDFKQMIVQLQSE